MLRFWRGVFASETGCAVSENNPHAMCCAPSSRRVLQFCKASRWSTRVDGVDKVAVVTPHARLGTAVVAKAARPRAGTVTPLHARTEAGEVLQFGITRMGPSSFTALHSRAYADGVQ
jgi:hypothetical protein